MNLVKQRSRLGVTIIFFILLGLLVACETTEKITCEVTYDLDNKTRTSCLEIVTILDEPLEMAFGTWSTFGCRLDRACEGLIEIEEVYIVDANVWIAVDQLDDIGIYEGAIIQIVENMNVFIQDHGGPQRITIIEWRMADMAEQMQHSSANLFLQDIKIIHIFDEPQYRTGSIQGESFAHPYTVLACNADWLEECWQVYDPFFSEYRNIPDFLIDHRVLPDINLVEGAIVSALVREVWFIPRPTFLEIYDWELISRPPRNWIPLITTVSTALFVGVGAYFFNKKYEIHMMSSAKKDG